jgi:hypothetical protein
MKALVFRTHIYAHTITEQVINLSEKTAVVYSRNHPRKGTAVITKYFVEALRAYMIGRSGISGAVRTNYIDVDNVLSIYEDIMRHEEELLFELIFG